MIATYCTARRSAYNGPRGVRNLIGGNRTRQTCGIFLSTVLGVTTPTSPINGREGKGIPNTLRRSYAVLNLPTALCWASLQLEKSIGGHHGQQ